MSTIIDELSWRGLIAQSTDLDALRAATRRGPITLYCGFDPTAPSLHLGNLVQILTVRRFQQHGHRPLALVGGATGLIGDPRRRGSGRSIPREVVEGWVERIREQLDRFYDFEGPNAAVAVNNLDWTEGMGVLEFLRDVGKHFSVNRMLDREAVAARLAADGISYTEFSYQLLQSYDFVQLYRRFGCTLQTGGSDQWGNIVAGVDLIRRMDGGSAHALTTPLMTKADGTKFGKTESGTVWLDPDLTSPYAFFQFWLNTDDRDVASLPAHVQLPAPGGDRGAAGGRGRAAPGARGPAGPRQRADRPRPRGGGARRGRGGGPGAVRPGRPGRPAGGDARAPPWPRRRTSRSPARRSSTACCRPTTSCSRAPGWRPASRRPGARSTRAAPTRTTSGSTDPGAQPAVSDLHHGEWLVLRRGKKAFAGVRVARP